MNLGLDFRYTQRYDEGMRINVNENEYKELWHSLGPDKKAIERLYWPISFGYC